MGPQLVPLGTCRHPKAPTVYPFGVLTDTVKGKFFVFWAISKILKPTTKSDEWYHILF